MNLEEYLVEKQLQPIHERTAIKWLRQLTEILHSIHQQQYFHRDIKPPNIMLKPDGQLALIDFGTAREVTQTFMQKLEGQQVTGIISAGYTPPEQMNGKAVPQSDFFALGRTFVYLLTGNHPSQFSEDSRTGELLWRDSAKDISPKLADLINYLMAPFPGNRPQDTQEILQKTSELNSKSHTSQRVVNNPLPNVGQVNHVVTSTAGKKINLLKTERSKLFLKRISAYIIDLVIVDIWIIFCIFTISFFYKPLDFAFTFALFFDSTFRYFEFSFSYFAFLFSQFSVMYALLFIMLIGVWLYFALFESSAQQATPGKKVTKIVVTNLQGNRISFWQATWRILVKTFFTVSFFWGIGLSDFILTLFRKDKRSLHDLLARTLVVNKK
jgi:eukaryotic-like serine/threonine-protein kinase